MILMIKIIHTLTNIKMVKHIVYFVQIEYNVIVIFFNHNKNTRSII
jgi:hypothetical protein